MVLRKGQRIVRTPIEGIRFKKVGSIFQQEPSSIPGNRPERKEPSSGGSLEGNKKEGLKSLHRHNILSRIGCEQEGDEEQRSKQTFHENLVNG